MTNAKVLQAARELRRQGASLQEVASRLPVKLGDLVALGSREPGTKNDER